jgi:hypothetical protein
MEHFLLGDLARFVAPTVPGASGETTIEPTTRPDKGDPK